MSSPTSMLHIRVDNEVKAQATHTLAAMGISLSDAVHLFLKRILTDHEFSMTLKTPNAVTRAAMEESREIMKARCLRFETADELFNDIEKNSK